MLTVESFSLCLEGFDRLLAAERPVDTLEAELLDRLEAPVRLLRWAIVKVEKAESGQPARLFHCEGAYLKGAG